MAAGKHGCLDRTGRVVIEPQYDAGWEFSRGLARVEVEGRLGYIDRQGWDVWPPMK